MRLSRRAAVVLAAVLLGPAVPSLATSDPTPVVAPVVRTAALAVGATTAALSDADQLVGVTWAGGDAQVRVRWLTAAGWTAWEVPEDDSDVPDAAERSAARGGTEPLGARAARRSSTCASPARPATCASSGWGTAGRSASLSFGATAHADARALLDGVHSPRGLGRRRVAAPRQALVRQGGQGRRRAPHGGRQRLHALPRCRPRSGRTTRTT